MRLLRRRGLFRPCSAAPHGPLPAPVALCDGGGKTPPAPEGGVTMPFSLARPFFLLALALLPTAARAGESHYLIIFGAQQIPNRPNYAHTFAVFVRATWPGDGPPCKVMLEAHTISWLPANGIIRTLSLLPECGRNYGLFET